MPENFISAYARRIAERDNPSPPLLSGEPAAVQARLEDWLLTAHKVRDKRGRFRLARMLLALMQHPERTTGELAEAAGLPARAAARMAVRLGAVLDLTTWDYRGLYRYHRLGRAAEDALLLVVAGPPAPAPPPL